MLSWKEESEWGIMLVNQVRRTYTDRGETLVESFLVFVSLEGTSLPHGFQRERVADSRSSLFSKELAKACIICSPDMVSVLKFLSVSLALNFSEEHTGLGIN